MCKHRLFIQNVYRHMCIYVSWEATSLYWFHCHVVNQWGNSLRPENSCSRFLVRGMPGQTSTVEGHLNPGLFNPKLQPQTPDFSTMNFSIPDFSTMNFKPWGWNVWGWKVHSLKIHGWKVWDWKVPFAHGVEEFLIEKSGVEKFMVEKSGVEAWG